MKNNKGKNYIAYTILFIILQLVFRFNFTKPKHYIKIQLNKKKI